MSSKKTTPSKKVAAKKVAAKKAAPKKAATKTTKKVEEPFVSSPRDRDPFTDR